MAVVLLATAGCGQIHDVEWEAPDNVDQWVTSNRYLDAARQAQAAMVFTVMLVVLVVVFTFAVARPGRRDTGRRLDDLPWAFLATVAVVGVVVVAWLGAAVS